MDKKYLQNTATQTALDNVLKYARELAYLDKTETAGEDDTYCKLQRVAVALAGLKDAVVRYDETLWFFQNEQ